ncbi:MAG: penicillin-binding protein activator [Cellvibrio sp.]
MLNRGITGALIVLLAFILASCSSQPTSDRSTSTGAVAPKVKPLLEQASQSASPERERLMLQAADLLIARKDYDWARNLLTGMDSGALEDDAYVKYVDLLSTVALEDGSYFLAQGILTNVRLERQWQSLDPQMEISLRQKRARVFALLGETHNSVRERITLTALLTDPQAEASNHEEIWQTLMTMSQGDLQERSLNESDHTLRGWYSLAALSKNNQTNLERQQAQVDAWRAQWPGHPANRNLPSDLQLLRTLIDNQPRQIALLLPLQGRLAKAGEAVRDGFFAAYYRASSERAVMPVIRQYDSSGDVLAVYDQAVNDGAELIIGPLEKEKVAELSLLPSLPVPVLTLNYPDTQPVTPVDGLYQFGLAAEDEARQVARQAYLEGHRLAMIMIPTQEWSERSAKAFSDEWQSLGGTVVNTSQFVGTGDYSRVIKSSMQIEESQARAVELERRLGTNLQFEARRRQDIDMIFLIADPAQARQIKPTLAFHYAGNIPVYATSHIYSGTPNPGLDRDLNGVRFNTMPWLFDDQNPEKKIIDQNTQSSAIYSRLHAMGVDAFRLYPRLPQLAQVPEMRLYGATGALRLLPDGRIEREQVWARIRSGRAQPLPTVVAETYIE